MEENDYGDELTEKMHSEFQVDDETDSKHRCFVVFDVVGTEDMAEIERVATDLYQIDMKVIARYIGEFKLVRASNES